MKLIDICYRVSSADAKCYISKNFKNMEYQIKIDCLDDAIADLENYRSKLQEQNKKEFYLKRRIKRKT